jgi:hypothetical protein
MAVKLVRVIQMVHQVEQVVRLLVDSQVVLVAPVQMVRALEEPGAQLE